MADGNDDENRFKEARRSLIDRQKGDDEGDEVDDDDEFEDEKTMLVDVDTIADENGESGGERDESARRSNDHTLERDRSELPGEDPTSQSRESKATPTAGVEAQSGADAPSGPSSGPPDDLPPTPGDADGGQDGPPSVQSGGSAHQEASLDVDSAGEFEGEGHGGGNNQKMVVPGDGGEESFDEKTEFVNLDDFADDGSESEPDAGGVRSGDMDPTGEVTMDDVQDAGGVSGANVSASQSGGGQQRDSQRFSPSEDADPGGFEGSTQFVNINDLSAGEQDPADEIRNDDILRSGYDFAEQGIECHDGANIVWAQNAIGKPVVLRQVWNGDPKQMPAGLRNRVATLDDLDIPGLLTMEGLFTSKSGCWVEMHRPTGQRLGVMLKQHGTLSVDETGTLLRGVAAILEDLHELDFVYANLCPDAVWLQEDWANRDDPRDGVILEPFDILSLGDRSRLGHFAPPELQQAEDRDELTPETDVYGLAAIGTAAVTGLPLNADRLQSLEDEGFVEALQTGMSETPADRQDGPATLADAAAGGWIRPVKEFAVDLAEEPVRLGIAVMALASVVVLGAMYVPKMFGSSAPPPSAAAGSNTVAAKGAPPAAKTKGKPKAGTPGAAKTPAAPDAGAASGGKGTAGGETDDDKLANSDLPGKVESLPNLKIRQSYRHNPPGDEGPELSEEERKKKIEKLRGEIQEILDEADRLKEDIKQERLKKALEKSARVIALQEGEPTKRDRELRDKLFEYDYVENYYEGVVSRAQKYLMDESIGEARFPFQSLTGISPTARGGGFFEQPNVSSVEIVEREDAPDDKKDKEESE